MIWIDLGYPYFRKPPNRQTQNGHSINSRLRLVWYFLITKQANIRYPSLMSRVNSVRDDSLSTATAFSSETAKNFPSVSSDTLGALWGDLVKQVCRILTHAPPHHHGILHRDGLVALAAGCWPRALEVFACTWGYHFHRSSCQPNTKHDGRFMLKQGNLRQYPFPCWSFAIFAFK